MNSPQFNRGNVTIFNKKILLNELKGVDFRSLLGLYVSKALLFLGISMVLLNNLNVIAPGSYFGAFNWVTISVFFIGLLINFFCIPFLYFSSLSNFKKESEFWDKETFWILPLFFFGTFFLYGAEISMASSILVLSAIIIISVHLKFIFEARKIIKNVPEEFCDSHGQYLVTMKYLTAYYAVLLVLLFAYNPLQHTFVWIRLHV